MKRIAACFALLTLGACHGEELRAQAPKGPRRYRPSWLVIVPDHVPAIRACLETREPPRFVVFVEPLSRGTGISTIDASGVVEHCAWDEGEIVRREPTRLSSADFEGLPVFWLGAAMPPVPTGVLLEEVLEDETTTLGWVYWPRGGGEEASVARGGVSEVQP